MHLPLLLMSFLASQPAHTDTLTLRNARAVWKNGRVHVAVDCADKREFAGRAECGFGTLCCVLLPDDMDEAVSIKQGGPFVATVTRNGLRIDGAFEPGVYDLEIRPPLRTRQGSVLSHVYSAHVTVDAAAGHAANTGVMPPLLPNEDALEPVQGAGEAPGDHRLQVSAGALDGATAWPLYVSMQRPLPAEGIDVHAACYARLVDEARDKAAAMSFHYDTLLGWQQMGAARVSTDANGRGTLACPLAGHPLGVRGAKSLAAVLEARVRGTGAIVGRALLHSRLSEKSGLALTVASANGVDGVNVDVAVQAQVPGCEQVDMIAEAVRTEWAWDYGGGRERSVVQPWRMRVAATVLTRPSEVDTNAWQGRWRFAVSGDAPHVLVRARCANAEAVRLVPLLRS